MIFSCTLLAGIDVFGDQSGVWSAENNPYNVIGDITVPDNESLEIQPGVIVEVQGIYQITVIGDIQVNGSVTDSIRFYGNEGLIWEGIRLENETLENNFGYCLIKNAETAINSINSPINISNCHFNENEKAIDIFGIGNPAEININTCFIENCQQNGVFIVENSNVTINSCNITQCALDGQPRGAIQLSSQGGVNDPVITDNWIHHNVWQGISAWDVTGAGNIYPLIDDNIIEYNLTGIYLYYANGEIRNNQINNNFVSGNPNSGAGVMISGSTSCPVLTCNTITGNFTGFYITDGASANIGDINNVSTDDDGMNLIYENIDESFNTWSVYNMSSADIKAENNVWDSDDDEEIGVTIFDDNDNPAFGIVDYEPYLPIFPPPDSVTYYYSQGILIIQIYPPSTPTYASFCGYNIYEDGSQIAYNTPFTFWVIANFPYGIPVTYGVSISYEDPPGYSAMVDTTIFVPHLLNPPQNLGYQIVDDHVHLTWDEPEPGSTSTFLHYNIYIDGNQYQTENTSYDIYDLINGQVYQLELTAEYNAGESDPLEVEFTYTGTFADDDIHPVTLLSNYPNPFNTETTIYFTAGSIGLRSTSPGQAQNTETCPPWRISIYNIKGQKVKEFLIISPSPGHTLSVTWDGTDDNRKSVPSGIYFCKLKTRGYSKTIKILLMK
jgi:parallel beta-helix repeat protein